LGNRGRDEMRGERVRGRDKSVQKPSTLHALTKPRDRDLERHADQIQIHNTSQYDVAPVYFDKRAEQNRGPLCCDGGQVDGDDRGRQKAKTRHNTAPSVLSRHSDSEL
jgi:hypothetical protein